LRSGPAQFEQYVLTDLPRLPVFAYFKELFVALAGERPKKSTKDLSWAVWLTDPLFLLLNVDAVH
jgi:hypothetical protein